MSKFEYFEIVEYWIWTDEVIDFQGIYRNVSAIIELKYLFWEIKISILFCWNTMLTENV